MSLPVLHRRNPAGPSYCNSLPRISAMLCTSETLRGLLHSLPHLCHVLHKWNLMWPSFLSATFLTCSAQMKHCLVIVTLCQLSVILCTGITLTVYIHFLPHLCNAVHRYIVQPYTSIFILCQISALFYTGETLPGHLNFLSLPCFEQVKPNVANFTLCHISAMFCTGETLAAHLHSLPHFCHVLHRWNPTWPSSLSTDYLSYVALVKPYVVIFNLCHISAISQLPFPIFYLKQNCHYERVGWCDVTKGCVQNEFCDSLSLSKLFQKRNVPDW